MAVKTVNLDSFEDYHEVSERLLEQKNQQDKKGIEVIRINSLLRNSNRTPETRAAFNRVVSEKEAIDQAVSDLEIRLANLLTIRSREICRELQGDYAAIVHHLRLAFDEFVSALNAERTFRMELEQRGVEVMWAQPPLLQVIDERIFENFREWILEIVPSLEKKETANQKRQRGGTTASN